jgi:hypothetical protein
MVEGANVAFFLACNYGEPTKFHHAYHHPEPDERIKWCVSIYEEFENVKNKGVWKVIPKEKILERRRCIKSEWVFKIKRNHIFRARLVTCGYSQLFSIYFTDSYAPVINDVSFRIILIEMMVCDLKSKIVDIKTEFLQGYLEKIIFMEVPNGMEVGDSKFLVLKKTIYGLKSCGFTDNLIEPCV